MSKVGVWLRHKVGGVSADDLLSDGISSIGDSLINVLVKEREMNLLYHCRYYYND